MFQPKDTKHKFRNNKKKFFAMKNNSLKFLNVLCVNFPLVTL